MLTGWSEGEEMSGKKSTERLQTTNGENGGR